MTRSFFVITLCVTTLYATPLFAAPEPLQLQVEAKLAEMGPGARFGLIVTDADGHEIITIAPNDRFIPASNTKMFTVAAALATLPGIDRLDVDGGASVRLEGRDVVLSGNGDARLSSASDCTTNCLATLADAIAAKTRRVRDVIGDATRFIDRRWSYGMSWNNVAERSGTGVAALSLDSNQLALVVTPGAIEKRPTVMASPYLAIDNRAVTVASGPTTLDVTRLPFERTVRLTGQIAAGAAPDTTWLGIDDPAHFAAWRLSQMLVERRVRITGTLRTRYRIEGDPLPATAGEPLARLTPPPLLDDLSTIDKVSQNLHAELLLRRVGAAGADPSVAGGLQAVQVMLTGAGVPRTGYDFADGSGMSTYNRVAPRAMIAFLRWTTTQPWSGRFRATLSVGGVDGTIARRFIGTPLAGKVYAKTGGLNATNALSGWLTAKSGRELTFAFFANDVPEAQRAIPVIDAVLNLVAAAN
ncbi:MAG: D-alanyl-D-alanine carboxypeptidase/D-alanyl-D-alanine endopeptidase [Sphingomonas sp.]